MLTATIRRVRDGPQVSVLATLNSDGSPQTSVIFVTHDEDDIPPEPGAERVIVRRTPTAAYVSPFA